MIYWFKIQTSFIISINIIIAYHINARSDKDVTWTQVHIRHGRITALRSIKSDLLIKWRSIWRARTHSRKQNEHRDSTETTKRAIWRHPRTGMCKKRAVPSMNFRVRDIDYIITYDGIQRLKISGRLQLASERIILVKRHFSQLRNQQLPDDDSVMSDRASAQLCSHRLSWIVDSTAASGTIASGYDCLAGRQTIRQKRSKLISTEIRG